MALVRGQEAYPAIRASLGVAHVTASARWASRRVATALGGDASVGASVGIGRDLRLDSVDPKREPSDAPMERDDWGALLQRHGRGLVFRQAGGCRRIAEDPQRISGAIRRRSSWSSVNASPSTAVNFSSV